MCQVWLSIICYPITINGKINIYKKTKKLILLNISYYKYIGF